MDELEELNQLISHPKGLQYVDQSLELEVYYSGTAVQATQKATQKFMLLLLLEVQSLFQCRIHHH